ncbi:galactolipase DONGLE, chloroplastic-like [Typha angustifolia]|uniref:galactolipase DONGLE, chloroplastic-like n=1 Tax=Typha angustifolia TaxID=59011 RepID=UPI003C2C7CB2
MHSPSLSTWRLRRPLPFARRAAVAATTTSSSSLPSTWREIQGSDDWRGLIDPLNPLLRSELVRYGEFVAACYDAFDLDVTSKRHLSCKYGKATILTAAGIGSCGYDVTKYIYATPDVPFPAGIAGPRWIGYVAVASDEEARRLGRRDVVVTFRGTATAAEWIANLMSSLTPARLDPSDPRPDVKVESGFLNLYTSYDTTSKFSQRSCRDQLLKELSRIIKKYTNEEMSITLAGHSMGSALALLLAYDVAELGLNVSRRRNSGKTPVTVYSFGGPRVGNAGFKARCEELGVKVLRVANARDPVTKLPGVLLNESFRVLGGRYGYAHVGVELPLDFFNMKDPACVHDLETYIRLLKCPHQKDRRGFLGKNKFDAWPWQDAAMQVGSMVQSLGF